jgi:hypothetical protein
VLQGPERAGDVTNYVVPLVVEELPFGVTPTAFVENLDQRGFSVSAVRADPGATTHSGAYLPQLLSTVEDAFLSDAPVSQVFAVTGESGTGKTTFLLRLAARLAAEGRAHLQRPAARATEERYSERPPPWTPVLLELRQHTVESLTGALFEHMKDVCGSDAARAALEVSRAEGAGPGSAGPVPRVRLLVMCDGADEMTDASSGGPTLVLRNLAATLCGGVPLPESVLRVVVTTRWDVPAGHGLLRRVLLPFQKSQVWRGARAGCCACCALVSASSPSQPCAELRCLPGLAPMPPSPG